MSVKCEPSVLPYNYTISVFISTLLLLLLSYTFLYHDALCFLGESIFFLNVVEFLWWWKNLGSKRV